MLYQLNGKNVKEEPKGKFLRVVEVPGKLKNYITKEPKGLSCKSLWLDETHIGINEKQEMFINGQII